MFSLDGSAIATRLSKQINKSCSEIKSILASYNSYKSELSTNYQPVKYSEVLDVKSNFYDKINFTSQVRFCSVRVSETKRRWEFCLKILNLLLQESWAGRSNYPMQNYYYYFLILIRLQLPCPFSFQVKSSLVPGTVIKNLIQFYIRKQRALEEISIVKSEMENTITYWKQQIGLLESFSELQATGTKFILLQRLIVVKKFFEGLQKDFLPIIGGKNNDSHDDGTEQNDMIEATSAVEYESEYESEYEFSDETISSESEEEVL